MRWSLISLAAVVLLLASPATVFGADRYVAKAGVNAPACENTAAPCATINYAVEQANSGDVIHVDEGKYVESVTTPKVLTFEGAGPGNFGESKEATIVRGPDGVGAAGKAAFDLPNGGSLIALRAEGGNGAGTLPGHEGGPGVAFTSAGPGLLRLEETFLIGGDGGLLKGGGSGLLMAGGVNKLELIAEDGEFVAGKGAFGTAPAAAVGGSAAEAAFVSPVLGAFGEPINLVGLLVTDGATAHIEGGLALARYGAVVEEGILTLNHVSLLSEVEAVSAVSSVAGTTAEAEVRNSLIFASQRGGVARTLSGGGSATLNVVGSTFLSFDGSTIAADAHPTGGVAEVTLRNSIARNDNDEVEPPPDLFADRGTIGADYSNFTRAVEVNGGTVSAPGSADNIAGDPGFTEGTGPFGELAKDSPLIDQGNPAIVQPGERDFDDEPRSLDGNRDCIAVPDIGAFEVTGESAPCPTQASQPDSGPKGPNADSAPTVTGFRVTNSVFAPKGGGKRPTVKRGTRFDYTLSEPAEVAITIERGTAGRKVRRGGRTRCVKAKTGAKPRCTRFVKVAALSADDQAGVQSVPFSGRVRGAALKPGQYRARIVATDSAGQTSTPRLASFRIVRG